MFPGLQDIDLIAYEKASIYRKTLNFLAKINRNQATKQWLTRLSWIFARRRRWRSRDWKGPRDHAAVR